MPKPAKPKVDRFAPSNLNEIQSFMHCGLCLAEIPEGVPPRDWARIEIGWTVLGLQAWCVRHEVNILHVDFEGQQHPANTSRAGTH